MNKCFVIFTVIFCLCNSNSVYAGLKDECFPCLNYDECLFCARLDNAEAQYSMHTMYSLGDSEAPKDLEKAHYWCLKAAKNGHSHAQFALAVMYENAEGVPKDLEKAFLWFSIAAESGDNLALSSVASFLEEGKAVPKNLEKAYALYSIAMENGDEYAKEYRESLEHNPFLDVAKAEKMIPLLKALMNETSN